jgi:hypothetical protein
MVGDFGANGACLRNDARWMAIRLNTHLHYFVNILKFARAGPARRLRRDAGIPGPVPLGTGLGGVLGQPVYAALCSVGLFSAPLTGAAGDDLALWVEKTQPKVKLEAIEFEGCHATHEQG